MSVSATSSVRPSNPIDSLIPTLPSENAETASSADPSGSKHGHVGMFAADDDSPSFWDLVDVINPLQHIPLVNDVYRDLTGDKIGMAARLTGGALFGGVFGLIGAAINGVMEESTGATAGGHMLALFRDDPATKDNGTALAQAPPSPGSESDAQPPTSAATAANQTKSDGKPDAKTDARPVLLTDLTGDEPAAPAAVPRPQVSASAENAPAAVSVAADANVNAEAVSPRSWSRKPARALSMPPRTTELATRTPPAVTASISSNSGRSALPVTGARPQSGLIAPANAAPIVAAQAEGAAAAAAAAPAAGSATSSPAANDWFAAAMAEGLNKYQRSNARAAEAAAP